MGAGAGTARGFYEPHFPGAYWTAIEIWEPYVEAFGLTQKYDKVIVHDVRRMAKLPDADLYIFGDVLEHMLPDEATDLWGRARIISCHLVINLPVLPYPQGPWEGNPYEEHVAQWTMESVLSAFPGITASCGPVAGGTVGAFVARGCT